MLKWVELDKVTRIRIWFRSSFYKGPPASPANDPCCARCGVLWSGKLPLRTEDVDQSPATMRKVVVWRSRISALVQS